jgi:membrane-bound serine protease (ClpP class)
MNALPRRFRPLLLLGIPVLASAALSLMLKAQSPEPAPASPAPVATTPATAPAPAPAKPESAPAEASKPLEPAKPEAKTEPPAAAKPASAPTAAPATTTTAPEAPTKEKEKEPVSSTTPQPAPTPTAPVKPTSLPEEGPYKGKIVVIPVGEEDLLNPARFEFMTRTLDRATKQRAEAVIFDLDTPGGRAWETATLIMEDLQKLGCRSVAFVNPRAISAGALIAIGTDAIYMSPRSSIGAATPVNGTGVEMGDAERAKMNSAFMAMARSAAVAKGYNPGVVDAMIDKDVGLKIGDKEVWPKGSIMTLDQYQATAVYDGKPLLAKGIANDINELISKEGLKGEVVTAEPKGFELLAIWITQYAAILLLIGLAAGYLEMQSPGMGIPAVIATIAFGLFFFGHFVAGSLVGYETVVVFVIGVALIVVELFVFPGHILPGLLGLACLFGALIYTMAGWDTTVPEGGTFPVRFADYAAALWNLAIAFGGAIAIILLLMRFFPTSGPFAWLVLKSAVGGEQVAIEGQGQVKASAISPGMTGTTRSALRPYGHVDFNGTQLEAMVMGDYLPFGTEVRVLEIQGGKIVVERV